MSLFIDITPFGRVPGQGGGACGRPLYMIDPRGRLAVPRLAARTRAVGRPGKGFERAVRHRVDEAAVAGARFLLDRRPFGVGPEGGPGRMPRGRVGPGEKIAEIELFLTLAGSHRPHRADVAPHRARRTNPG